MGVHLENCIRTSVASLVTEILQSEKLEQNNVLEIKSMLLHFVRVYLEASDT